MNPQQPNVLFIAVDDLRPELGCYGAPQAISPRIDGLAETGVLFQHAYCQSGVCNPSRASLMTGMRPDTIHVWDLDTHFREHAPDVVTLPQRFRQAGYHAAAIGKIYHNILPDPPSWSEPRIMIPGYPYDPDAVYRDEANMDYLERRKRDITAEGYQKNATCKGLVEFVDIYPTLCDLAGIDIDPALEGTSLTPQLRDPERPARDAAFSQFLRHGPWQDPSGRDYMGYTVRTEAFRYVEWYDHETGELAARELYDHRVDSDENMNVADDPEFEAVVRDLAARLPAPA